MIPHHTHQMTPWETAYLQFTKVITAGHWRCCVYCDGEHERSDAKDRMQPILRQPCPHAPPHDPATKPGRKR